MVINANIETKHVRDSKIEAFNLSLYKYLTFNAAVTVPEFKIIVIIPAIDKQIANSPKSIESNLDNIIGSRIKLIALFIISNKATERNNFVFI